jgi:hypothetical protein
MRPLSRPPSLVRLTKRAHVARAPDKKQPGRKKARAFSQGGAQNRHPTPSIHRTHKLSEAPDSLCVKQRRSHLEPAEWPGARSAQRSLVIPTVAVRYDLGTSPAGAREAGCFWPHRSQLHPGRLSPAPDHSRTRGRPTFSPGIPARGKVGVLAYRARHTGRVIAHTRHPVLL